MSSQLPFWLEKFSTLVNQEKMHHAFLISGKKGVGKTILAKHLSMLTLCTRDDFGLCGTCGSCKLSTLHNHPDFHELRILPDKKLVGISQIHELRNKLYESPFLGKNKVAYLENLEKFSTDGLNAVLKILEEPPSNTFFFLTSHFYEQIPQTIRSRCFDLKISSPSIEDSLNLLSDYPKKDALKALQLNNGSPLAALEFLEKGLLKIREDFIKEISGIIKEGKDIISISENWIDADESLNIKIEWMSCILSDAVRFNADQSIKHLNSDTDNISKYLGSNSKIEKIHELLGKTNALWNLFSRDTNLRKDYQLNSLFVDWERGLGISKKT